QAGFAELFKLVAALGADVFKVGLDTLAAGVNLFQSHLTGRTLRLELALLPADPGQALLQPIALLLQLVNALAQRGDSLFVGSQLLLLQLQTRLQLPDLLLPRQHARLLLGAGPVAQPVATKPVARRGNQRFMIGQRAAQGQCLLQITGGPHTGQPGRQVQCRSNLAQQRFSGRRGCRSGILFANQPELALLEADDHCCDAFQAVGTHCLSVRRVQRFDRLLPARLNQQRGSLHLGILQTLLAQPLLDAGALIQRCLLQSFERGQTDALTLILAATDIQFLAQRGKAVTLLLQVVDDVIQLLLVGLAAQLQLGKLLGQFRYLVLQPVGRQAGALLFQPLDALTET